MIYEDESVYISRRGEVTVKQMQSYRVVWELDVEAENPQEAAREAEDIQRMQVSEHGQRGVFDVFDEEGNKTEVDLEADDGE